VRWSAGRPAGWTGETPVSLPPIQSSPGKFSPNSPRTSPKKKSGLAGRLPFPNFGCGLDAFDVLCLPALGAFDDVELNLLTFLQAAKTVCLDGGEVNENVLAILAADKTIALGIVKPLYCSCFHDVAMFLLG
jgi:hypothetical protein